MEVLEEVTTPEKFGQKIYLELRKALKDIDIKTVYMSRQADYFMASTIPRTFIYEENQQTVVTTQPATIIQLPHNYSAYRADIDFTDGQDITKHGNIATDYFLEEIKYYSSAFQTLGVDYVLLVLFGLETQSLQELFSSKTIFVANLEYSLGAKVKQG